MKWVTTYDEPRRRGHCSCGCWTTYDVTRQEFEAASRRHLAWHATRENRARPPRPPRAAEAERRDLLHAAGRPGRRPSRAPRVAARPVLSALPLDRPQAVAPVNACDRMALEIVARHLEDAHPGTRSAAPASTPSRPGS